uniref:Phlebovirus glycoprotein G2 fusion domain-containing protein n=1 Tax=Heterorhabditis bacteriophora TaxID=37862 RepID=A0A1I7WPV3_HETBA
MFAAFFYYRVCKAVWMSSSKSDLNLTSSKLEQKKSSFDDDNNRMQFFPLDAVLRCQRPRSFQTNCAKMFYLAYFPRPAILRGPSHSDQMNLMAKCRCPKSLESAAGRAQQLFWLHELVPSPVETSNSVIRNVLRSREPLPSIECRLAIESDLGFTTHRCDTDLHCSCKKFNPGRSSDTSISKVFISGTGGQKSAIAGNGITKSKKQVSQPNTSFYSLFTRREDDDEQ